MHNSSYVIQVQYNTDHSKTLWLPNCNNQLSNCLAYFLEVPSLVPSHITYFVLDIIPLCDETELAYIADTPTFILTANRRVLPEPIHSNDQQVSLT